MPRRTALVVVWTVIGWLGASVAAAQPEGGAPGDGADERGNAVEHTPSGALTPSADAHAVADPSSSATRRADWERPPALETPGPRWYGYQTLLIDAGAVAMFGLAIELDVGALSLAGALTLVVGAPLVHIAHDNDAATTSVALRLVGGVAFVIGGLGCALAGLSEGGGGGGLCVVGQLGLVTLAVAVILDAAIFAWDAPRRSGFALGPLLERDGRGGGLALYGTF